MEEVRVRRNRHSPLPRVTHEYEIYSLTWIRRKHDEALESLALLLALAPQALSSSLQEHKEHEK